MKTLENVLFGAGHLDASSAATSMNLSSPSATNEEKPRHVLFEDVELERQRIEEELNKTRLRLLNTTELLNESELNNVRLSEQVSLLKDEIRRIERNMERAESISNLEYLKNVIVKFFILRSTPETLAIDPRAGDNAEIESRRTGATCPSGEFQRFHRRTVKNS